MCKHYRNIFILLYIYVIRDINNYLYVFFLFSVIDKIHKFIITLKNINIIQYIKYYDTRIAQSLYVVVFRNCKKKKEIKCKTAVGVGSKRIELDVDFIISFL